MICPNENVEMRPIKVESHYGQSVILDQCPECGGIWFDKLELYMAKQGQADKIEALDVDLLRTSSAIENSRLLCPRDQVKLVRFVDPFFPEEIIIERCPICEGFWLNRGEFSKYQRFRQEKMNQTEKTPVDIKLEQDIEHILLEYKNGDPTAVLGKLGKFLSIPLDSTNWRPLEPEKLGEKEENALNLILNVLSIILRTFIKI